MNIRQPIWHAGLFCLLLASISSCKKSAKPFDNFPRATQTIKYLTQAAWKETKLEYEYQDGTWAQKSLGDGVTSETIVFYTNGAYTVFNADGSVNTNGIYDLIGDYTQLALNKSITYDFTTLNNTTMQLGLTGQIPYTDPSTGITTNYYGMRQTFIH